MTNTNITGFRKNIVSMAEQTIKFNEPINISTKDGNAFLMSKSDYIKMIAFDLDGTLLSDDKSISQRTYNVLRLAAERGIELVPASGRSYAGIPDEIKGLPGVNYIITTNGAAIYTPSGRLIRETAVERKTAVEIISKVNREHAIAAAYIDGKGYMESGDIDLVPRIGLGKTAEEYFRSTRIFVDSLTKFIMAQGNDIQLLTFAVDPLAEDVHRKIAEAVSEYEGISLVFGSAADMDINHEAAGKGNALLSVAELLGIDASAIAAFGDSANDMDMLRCAGFKVAMKNGDEAVKAIADIIAPPNYADGAAAVIERILGA